MYTIVILILLLLLLPQPLQSKVYLDIHAAGMRKIVIAIPRFDGPAGLQLRNEIPDSLSRTLEFSGFFTVAPWSLLDSELQDEPYERERVMFNKWRSIGVEILVKGRLKEEADEIISEISIYDTETASLEFAKRYRSKRDQVRVMVYRISDDIIEALTGLRGISSLKIVFVSGQKGNTDIFISHLDGFGRTRLTNFGTITVVPSISPGGRYLSYTSYKEGSPNLYIHDLERGTELYVDRSPGMKVGKEWIDSKTLIYSYTSGRYSQILKLDVEKKEKKSIFKTEGIVTSPVPSPDGKQIFFTSDMHGSPQIFSMDLASGQTRRITFRGNYNSSPSISPRGDLMAFVSRVNGALEICLQDLKNDIFRVLTNDGGINDSPHFSPCGRYILFSSTKGGKTRLNIVLVNGENRRTLSITGQNESQPRFVLGASR